jgi:hypothetical protein
MRIPCLDVLLGEPGGGSGAELSPAPHRVGEPAGIDAHNAAQVQQLPVQELQQAERCQGREDLPIQKKI